jgi:hypothetical protein
MLSESTRSTMKDSVCPAEVMTYRTPTTGTPAVITILRGSPVSGPAAAVVTVESESTVAADVARMMRSASAASSEKSRSTILAVALVGLTTRPSASKAYTSTD